MSHCDRRARSACVALASWSALVSASCGAAGATEQAHDAVVPREAGTMSDQASTLEADSGGLSAAPPILAPTPQPDPVSILNASCAVATVRSQLLPVNLLFVLDRSGSMNCNPPPTTNSQTCENETRRANLSLPSKWEITQQALIETLRQLPSTSRVGLSYFSGDDACAVSATPDVPLAALDSGQLSALKTSLAGVVPNGGTPLVGATILAYQHLHTLALANAISGNSFVVLLTDGQQSDQCSDGPRCGDARECTALLTDREAPKAAGPGVGIRTFVIGAPGSEPARTALSQLATSGGTAAPGCDADAGACHFDMTQQSDFATALTQALTAIGGTALTCELPLPTVDGVQVDLDLVNVLHIPGDGTRTRVILRDFRAACDQGTEGWRYSRDLARIELCDATCGRLRADEAARLDVVIGCPAAQPI